MSAEQAFAASVRKKIRRERRVRAQDGFPKMGKHHYLPWLGQCHKRRKPTLYLEIGTESGASLSLAECASIAIDPQFRIADGTLGTKPEIHFFQKTSDDFFASQFLEYRKQSVDFAFLDGMHLIEFLLRDFINVEKFMSVDGMVAIHDCVPMSHEAAERKWDRQKTRAWTGDVWKIAPILGKYRPDLRFKTLDLAPTGLLVVENLDPTSNVLIENYQAILEEFVDLALEEFGLDQLEQVLNIQRVPEPAAAQKSDRWQLPATANRNMLRIAIKTPKARPSNPSKLVDLPFAQGLADALMKQGHSVRIDSGADWYNDTTGTDFDLLLRGRGGFEKQENVPLITWVIYPGISEEHQVSDEEIADSDFVFFASQLGLDRARNRGFEKKCALLMQCFDTRVMYPSDSTDDKRTGIVFVGSNRFGDAGLRPIVKLAIESDLAPEIWGRGWKNSSAEKFLKRRYLANEKLGGLYRSASAVLCDHQEAMRVGGYVSNRIFDALACGAPVISDDVYGIPDELGEFVEIARTTDEMKAAVTRIENETLEKRERRAHFAREMIIQHSFEARAAIISKTLIDLKRKSG